MKSDLTIITVVENDNGLLDLMIKSVYKFTKPIPQVIICDQGKNGTTLRKYKDNKNITIVKNDPKISGGSNRHASGLNKIFPMVNTKKTAVIESDCILLCGGWDNIPVGKKMIAADKVKSAFHICFILFETEILKGVDFRPGKQGSRTNRSYKSNEDVGWQINNIINQKDVHKMKFIDCKTGIGHYFDSSFQSDEFWIDNKSTLAHFGRGSNINGKAIRKGFKHPKDQLVSWKYKAEEILK